MTDIDTPYFPTNFVSREDLLSARPDLESEILAMSDIDIAHIADEVGDALQEMYSMALPIVLANYLGVSEVSDSKGNAEGQI
jgi:hypothetical protein